MPLYQVTVKQGRSDTITAEFSSVNNVKEFFSKVSTAKITSIKEIVYSKEYNVNFTQKTIQKNTTKEKILFTASSDNYSQNFIMFYPLQDLTSIELQKSLIKNKIHIDKEPITSLINFLTSLRALARTES